MNMEFLHWAIRNHVQLHFGETHAELLNPVPFIKLQTLRHTVVYPLPRDAELMEEILPWIFYRARAELGDTEQLSPIPLPERDKALSSKGEAALHLLAR